MSCDRIAPAAFCLEGPGAIPTGATSIDVFVTGSCLSLCTSILCNARVTGTREVTLDVFGCSTADVCPPACATRLDGTCALPELAEGSWTFVVNGGGLFTANVSSIDLASHPVCWTPSTPASPAFECQPPAAFSSTAAALCRDVEGQAGEATTIDVVDECANCFESSGGCRVDIVGDSISLTANERTCGCAVCGVCAPVCTENVVHCVVPPLEAGEYDLIGGGITSDFTVGTRMTDRRCTRVIVP
jgi:hypothetical protein